jgi:sterol desaturase/sphingolipid hydroxylase (fatty acid hydroxylase superfamily)
MASSGRARSTPAASERSRLHSGGESCQAPAVLQLVLPVAAVMALDAALLTALAWAYHAPRFADRRISPMPPLRVSPRERLLHIVGNSTLSLLFVVGLLAAIQGFAIRLGSVTWWRVPVDAAAIVLVYDFLYYWFHRTLHHRRLMPFVHSVHHRAKNPSALESFYLHPVELFGGLALLHLSVALYAAVVGPVHAYVYAVVFLVHSTFNIIVHAGITTGLWLLTPFDLLAKKHSVHHKDDFNKNYASLTPIPDWVFRTSS